MIEILSKQKEYELLDSGDGFKLERYGDFIFSRPDPEVLWKKSQDAAFWKKADLEFIRQGTKGKWNIKKGVPESWQISFADFNFVIRPTSFKHTGLFPEQISNWLWMASVIEKEKRSTPVKVLNLFAYTGGATLACSRAGAEVCHVDGSKSACAWARENAEVSGLGDNPIRWIVDDCIVFLKREVKRGNTYDAIVMDPPAFGHGPKDELWKIDEHFSELISLCTAVLSDDPLFVLINGYTAGYSPIVYENILKDMMDAHKGKTEKGELAIEESARKHLLPAGIFARWSKNG